MEIRKRNLRIALEKVRRRLRKKPYYLPPTRVMFCFILNFIFLVLVCLYYVSRKIKRLK